MPKTEHFLDFEHPLLEVVRRIKEVKSLAEECADDLPEKNIDSEINRLEIKAKTITRRIYRNLTPWQKVQVARHQDRPHAQDFINNLVNDFIPLAGDRKFADDKAMIAGIGKFQGRAVCILGIEKGRNTKDRVKYSFGMPRPEGYRKALRIMDLAKKFNLPLITFVDTPGAFPGIDAEERGQSEAIASCIEKLFTLPAPVITIITGEGGSGGALAIAVADKVLMLEHSVYSVISPEGCASILWRDAKEAESAAAALKLTSKDLDKLNIIDGIIKEPVGGAHRDYSLTFKRTKSVVLASLEQLEKHSAPNHKLRREKFLNLTRLQ